MKPLTQRWYWKLYNLSVVATAMLWRRLLPGLRVIAVSGSLGKTTTKECLVAILSSRFPTIGTIGNDNGRRGLPRLLLRARPAHRYLVAEVGIRERGHMWRSAWLLRPDAVVMTSVARQHTRELGDLDAVAREKSRLLARLPANGLAVLNQDDPRVADMAAGRECTVCHFGSSSSADFWAEDVAEGWPERLELTLRSHTESQRIRTRLVGEHWVPALVAAAATASRCGVSLRESAEALRQVEPFPARLQPVELPCGATMLRDEYNGTMDTYRSALAVLRGARAARRLAIVGSVSDHAEGDRMGLREVARDVAGAAEVAVFVGPDDGERRDAAIAAGMRSADVHCFPDARTAAAFLRGELRGGDLALLKGTWDDHLSRIYFALRGTVECWIGHCSFPLLCDDCPRLQFRAAASR